MSHPIIWSISGSDCSGGAGIQADIKTAFSLDCELCTLITANTVQNNERFEAMNPVDVAILEAQFQCLIGHKLPAVVKIGLLASAEQVAWLLEKVAYFRTHFPKTQFVLDTVLKASVQTDTAQLLTHYDRLLKAVDVITPNYDEVKEFVEISHHGALAWALFQQTQTAVILKGGHAPQNQNNVIDEYVDQNRHIALTQPMINTTHSHGGGCTFATALACFLAKGRPLHDAFVFTKAFMQKGFSLNQNNLASYGAFKQPKWPVERRYYPQVERVKNLPEETNQPSFASLDLQGQALGLYPVVDSLEWLEKLLPLGLNIIQLRVKDVAGDALDTLIQQAVLRSKKYPKTRLFINDFWALAIKHGAYGIHLGQEDMQALSPTEVVLCQRSGIRLGLSSHGVYEYLIAEQYQPSYIAIGAIFPTQTKDMSSQIQGTETLADIVNINQAWPLVAIGGISLNNIQSVQKTGVDSVAVVSAITQASDYLKAVDLLRHP
jgi:hydroxymethylpyrimidine kinase/phosphomethylpyrimidine kinase/thiamine-phosphate diphosphorylase